MPRITIERMSHDDVPAVMAVDNLCFPTPWSENAYRSEMGNVSAYYVVARLRGHWSGGGAGRAGRLVGFAGAWIVVDEAHITTIGVHPEYRRHGIGELLFAALLDEAAMRGVRRASLEVRESNRGAQSLYAKFGFVPIARRRRYYSDTGEDAIVMWIEDLQAGVGHGCQPSAVGFQSEPEVFTDGRQPKADSFDITFSDGRQPMADSH